MNHRNERPLWAEIDLGAITHNVSLLRQRAGRPVKILAPVKANAYGHGVVGVSRHLQQLGVEGLATANFDDAVAARAAGVTIPILMYGSQLPNGTAELLKNDLTPSVWSREGLEAAAGLSRLKTIAVHIKVDAGLGRIGVRPDEAASLAREVLSHKGLALEGIYTHIPFSDGTGGDWSRRRLAAFAEMVRAIEQENGIRIPFAQAAASSVLSQDFPDGLNTIAPGHLVFGLHPVNGARAETLGFRKVLRALKAKLIHVGHRRAGDDMYGTGESGLANDMTVGVILFGMDNGLRPPSAGMIGQVLCRGQRCRILAVSAEYAVIDVSTLRDARVGDDVTLIGSDGGDAISIEDVAAYEGAPSAAYWQVALRNVPLMTV